MPLGPGDRLGPYEIRAVIAVGGMGEVYRAVDARLGRDVAIKVLPSAVADDPDRLLRFTREARAAAAISHPNIVTIYDVGKEGRTAYLTMELVDGETLRVRMLRGKLRVAESIDIGRQIASGLAKAHESGIVHRDLKPENVMLTTDGVVKILDFGLGKTVAPAMGDSNLTTIDVASALSQPGLIIGTIGYMSPEQAAGRDVDFRSDQFALGCILYQLLAGTAPFRRDTPVQTLAAVIEEPSTPLPSAVPRRIVRIVDRCLEKEPDERYASTRDLRHDLEHVFEEPGTAGSRRVFAGTRSRWIAAGVTIAIAALAGLSVRTFRDPPAEAPRGAEELAILPFVNVGGDPSNQPFSDGLVEILTSQLTEIAPPRALHVVPATDVRREGVASAREARQAFGVSRVLTGSVLRTPTSVRVTLNLVDASTLRQVSARSMDMDLEDVTAMQDGVVHAVATLLGTPLNTSVQQALSAGNTSKPEAYDVYVRGRGFLQRYENVDNIDQAIAAFTQAVGQDQRFALAYAGLGEAYWRRYEQTKDTKLVELARSNCDRALQLGAMQPTVYVTVAMVDRGTGNVGDAIEALQRALELDPVNAIAYQQLGGSYESLGRLPDAEATFRKAVDVRPNYWAAHNDLGGFYYRRGRLEDAAGEFRKVTELTPDNARGYSSLGAMYFLLKRYDDARTTLEKSIAIKPLAAAYTNLGNLYFYQQQYAQASTAFARATQMNQNDSFLWHNLAAAYQWSGQREQARAAFQRTATLAETQLKVNPRQANVVINLADCYSMLDQPDRARALVQRAMELAPNDVPIMFDAGVVYEQLGDRNRALDWIEKAVRGGYARDLIDKAPSLAGLRADPRFRAFSAR